MKLYFVKATTPRGREFFPEATDDVLCEADTLQEVYAMIAAAGVNTALRDLSAALPSSTRLLLARRNDDGLRPYDPQFDILPADPCVVAPRSVQVAIEHNRHRPLDVILLSIIFARAGEDVLRNVVVLSQWVPS